MQQSVIITGSGDFLGKEISNYFEKLSKVHKLDLSHSLAENLQKITKKFLNV